MMKYTPDHEWLDDSDGDIAVGITEFAAGELGDIVFIELPEVGDEVAAGDEVVVIESVKAASEISSPIDGTVTAVNRELVDNPGLINEDAEGTWFYRMEPQDPDAIDSLLDEDAYQDLIAEK